MRQVFSSYDPCFACAAGSFSASSVTLSGASASITDAFSVLIPLIVPVLRQVIRLHRITPR